MSASDQLMRLGIELKFTEKRLGRSVTKLQTEYKQKDKLLVAAMKKGNHEHAKIHAESMIRIKKDIKFTQILAAKVSGMRIRLGEAQLTQQVTSVMCKLSQSLQADPMLNVENVKRVVDTFESATETIEVMEEVVDHAMTKVSVSMNPADEVDELIAQVAEENTLELASLLPAVSARVKQSQPEKEADDIDLDELEMLSAPKTQLRSAAN